MKPLHTAALAGALLALAACTAANVKPGTRVSTALKTGQSWVVTRPVVAAQVLDGCARGSSLRHTGEITGYWAPGRADIEALESRLSQLQPAIPEPARSGRQYVGFQSGEKRLIYINAFSLPDHNDIDPSREAVRVCDGGSRFWTAIYDPQSATFTGIERASPAQDP